MKNLILVAILLGAVSSQANNETIFLKLDELLKASDFSNAFQEGDDFSVTFLEKSPLGNSRADTKCITYFSNKDEKAATIDCGNDPRKPSSREIIDEANWSSNKGNTARMLIRAIESYGYKLALAAPIEVVVTLKFKSDEINLTAYKVGYSGSGAFGSKIDGELYLSPYPPGRMQILKRVEKTNRPYAITRTWTIGEISRRLPE